MKTSEVLSSLIILSLAVACANTVSHAPGAPGVSQKSVTSSCPTFPQNTYTSTTTGATKYLYTDTTSDLRGNLLMKDLPLVYIVNGQPQYMPGNRNQSFVAYCTSITDPITAAKAIVINTYQGGVALKTITYAMVPSSAPLGVLFQQVDVKTGDTDDQEQFNAPSPTPTPTPLPAPTPTPTPTPVVATPTNLGD